MGLFSWLFGTNKKVIETKPIKKAKRNVYGFDEKRQSHTKDLEGFKKSSLKIKRVKIIVDKQDIDACPAIKRMKKVYNLADVPLIPLDRLKCQHCTCYYEPILPKD
ncbi:hypothetical protein [Acinetobacter sp. CE-15]|uniref:hypothetical protein n=1 Tax=Acinetobacter sp. CE-15 TaxID=3425693 RepID=UPI003DA21B44